MNDMISIKKFLNDAIKKKVFPGCHFCLIKNNSPQYLYLGNKSDTEVNDCHTIYDLASLTKVISTTTLILIAMDEKKLTINTTVRSILPQFIDEKMTIQHLLTHTSGLPADVQLPIQCDKQTLLATIYKTKRINEVGKVVVYSDLGFILLGEILEMIYRLPLDTLAKTKVFEPLEMKNTTYNPKNSLHIAPTEYSIRLNKLIRGNVHDRKASYMNGVAGHAGVFSTVEDLSRYCIMILEGGVYNGKRLLSQQSIQQLFTCFTPSEQPARSLGYIIDNQTIMHTGFTGTSILIDKEKKMAILLLSNRIYPSRENTQIIDWRKKLYHYVMK